MSIKQTAKNLVGKFNFTTSVSLNGKQFKVPIIKNMGLLNRALNDDDWFLQLLRSINMPADASFVDIGVNVGQTLLKFRSCSQNQYWGFEPNASCVYYANQLIKANGFTNVSIIPAGLSTENKVAKFYVKNDVDSAGTTVNDLRPGFYDADNVIFVPLFSFDEFNADGMIKNIALIKIDVEGGELEVLQGMQESIGKHKPVIVCEILDSHNDENIPKMQARADKLMNLMHSIKYDAYGISINNGKIESTKIDRVIIKKWTAQSWDQNDYLFLPQGKNLQSYLK